MKETNPRMARRRQDMPLYHGIIFKEAMQQASVEGYKTVTRRLVEPYVRFDLDQVATWEPELEFDDDRGFSWSYGPGGRPLWTARDRYGEVLGEVGSPFGKAGDLLWQREPWASVPRTAFAHSEGVQQIIDPADPDFAVIYKRGWPLSCPGTPWKSSLHLRMVVARHWYKVQHIRIERLQSITEESALSEGITPEVFENHRRDPFVKPINAARFWYAKLWNLINEQRSSWDANPWVFVIKYHVTERPALIYS